jgi:hypothetical protein
MPNVSDGKWEFPSAGVTQLVECDLAKVDVAGSNPVSRSIFFFLFFTFPREGAGAPHIFEQRLHIVECSAVIEHAAT